MGVHVATKQTTPPQRADPQRFSLHKSSCEACSALSSPVHRLQRAVGNRVLSSLLRSPIIQPKLTVSQPDDQYEREADRVADQVMRMADGQGPSLLRIGNVSMVQRKCACDGGSGQPCKCDQETETVQRHAASSAEVSSVPQSVPQVLRSFGRPLDAPTRNLMESRFGQDFSGVRVHTGGDAAASARSIKAHAFTVGNHVVFGANQYQPATDMGRRLLAHELAHVIQQGGKSGVVHRQPQNPPTNPPTNPPPAPAKFSPTPGCLVNKTNEQIPVDPNTVTVIEYGATWCGSCGEEQKFLVELCNEYKGAKTAAPVRFFLVDASDDSPAVTGKTWPPVPNSLPTLLVYSGQFQTFKAQGPTTKAEVKAAIDHAIGCASSPLKKCPPLEEPAGGTGCTIQPAAIPKGKRYKFVVNTVNFAPGEEARLDADIKKMKPGSRVDLLGLASSDGAAATNRVLSCQRALTATRVFARNSIIVRTMLGSGPVPGTDNKPEFRAVDVVMTDPITPIPVPPAPTKTGKCDPPTCVPDFVISGPTILRKPPKISDPKAAPPGTDPKQFLQTYNCDSALFQIVPGPTKTSNVSILHVQWKKDPPAGTLSVPRSAFDDTGDDPAPAQKAPSFAALNPITGSEWQAKVEGSGSRQACWTSKQVPSWCVPFCSFGRFTMVATVTWVCDDTECTNKFTTATLNIDVQKIP